MFEEFVEKLRSASQSDELINPYHKGESTLIIAYGSEAGSTLLFAKALHQFILEQGIKSYLVEMNDFQHFPLMDYLIVLTSTHGVGGAPFNALQFIRRFKSAAMKSPFTYAVVGFGSRQYPTYCHYAENVNHLLRAYPLARKWIQLTRINNKSLQEFELWFTEFCSKLEGQLSMVFD